MIKLFNTKFENININSVVLNDNNLYILYSKNVKNTDTFYKNDKISELHLLIINLITRNIKNNHITTDLNYTVFLSKIINDIIYVHKHGHTYIYNYNLKLLKHYDYRIHTIMNINDKLYFLKCENYLCSLYDENDNRLLDVNFGLGVYDNGIILADDSYDVVRLHLDYFSYDYNIFSHNEYIIFHNIESNKKDIILYNTKTKKLLHLNEYMYEKISNTLFITYIDEKYYIYDILTNEYSELPNYLSIYINNNNKIIKIDDYHYLIYNNNELTLYYKKIMINNDLSDKKILIGTNKNKIRMSLDLLLNNSEYIKDIFQNYNGISYELIHDSFENIYIYDKFLKNRFNKKDYNKLVYLFKICDFMQDKNINLVEKMIIEYLEYDDVNINHAFYLLKVLFSSNSNYLSVFNIILSKYKFVEIKEKIKQLNKNSTLYDFCFDELLKNSTSNKFNV